MTDSSSENNPEVAQMAGELFQAKIEAARGPQTMTHLLQIGSFRMEIVPDGNDVTEFFTEMVDKLHGMYGDEVLKARILHDDSQKKASAHMHG